MLAAFLTGALVTVAVYLPMLANARNEVELNTKQLSSLLAELDELRVEMMRLRVQQMVKIGNTSQNVAPNYTYIDLVIEDPPSDDAARSLFYKLAYEIVMFQVYTCSLIQ